jgi:hypothetical protein
MSQTTPPPAALRKLPVLETVLEAYRRVFGNLALVARAALFPFVLSMVLVAVSFGAAESPLLTTLAVILGFLPYTIFGVAWHRVTLLGPVAGMPPLVPALAQRHWRFLGYLMAVTVIGYAVTAMVFSLALAVFRPVAMEMPLVWGIALIVGVLILAYVIVRLSFVFPAVAVDEAYRLKHSWTHTKGQGFRLLGAVIVTAVPMLVLLWPVSWLFGMFIFSETAVPTDQGSALPEAQMEAFIEQNLVAIFVSQVAIAVLNYLLMALLVSVISIAFRTCTGWVPAMRGAPAVSGGRA